VKLDEEKVLVLKAIRETPSQKKDMMATPKRHAINYIPRH